MKRPHGGNPFDRLPEWWDYLDDCSVPKDARARLREFGEECWKLGRASMAQEIERAVKGVTRDG